MRLAIALVLLAASSADAEPEDDEGLELLDAPVVQLHVRSENQSAASALINAPDGPYLRFAPIALANGVALGAKERAVRQAWTVGTRLVLSTENVAWKSDPDLDITSRGWRASGTASLDLGRRFRLDVTYGKGNIESRYVAGTYTDTAVALTKTKQLSRWMTGWVSLALAHRTWEGGPPAGEADSSQVMLTIGTTFR